MELNFIREEIRDYEPARQLMSTKEYDIYHMQVDGVNVGFIAIWQLDGFCFVEHFVTYEKYRGMGYGSKALSLLKKDFKSLVLEVEPPTNENSKRRIAFYQRTGFVLNDYPYMQPSYRKNGEEVELILMSTPKKLDNPQKIIQEVYKKVYGKYNE